MARKGQSIDDSVWSQFPLTRRETYEGRTRLVAEMPILGRLQLQEAIPHALHADTHPREYEVHLVQDGCLEMWTDSTRSTWSVHGGLAVLTQPGQLHGGVGEILGPGRWYWLRFRIPVGGGRGLPGLSPNQTRRLLRALSAVVPPVFAASPAIEDCFERLLAEHRHPRPDSPLMVRSILHELMLWIVRDHRAAAVRLTGSDEGFSPPIQKAVAWLNEHLSEDMQIPQLADVAGLSESYFRSWFHREVGFSPGDYLVRRRIERARELLRTTQDTITRVGLAVGFSTPAYFASVFRRQTGYTPTQFREQSRHRSEEES